ncbi:MarR family transcriptional regulator [bacterium]|nr:MarR family transcriptional regulator [bacterium]
MNKKNNVAMIKELGCKIRTLFRDKFDGLMPEGVTRVEGRFLGYIYEHQEEGVISTDLVNAFQLKKSTVSETLSSLERKGFIVFRRSQDDARKKIICLAEKGIKHERAAAPIIAEFDAILENALSEEEKAQFEVIFEKLCAAIQEKIDE